MKDDGQTLSNEGYDAWMADLEGYAEANPRVVLEGITTQERIAGFLAGETTGEFAERMRLRHLRLAKAGNVKTLASVMFVLGSSTFGLALILYFAGSRWGRDTMFWLIGAAVTTLAFIARFVYTCMMAELNYELQPPRGRS